MLTPSTELKVINAQLDTATENLAQANNRLKAIQSHQLQQGTLLFQASTKLSLLQDKIACLEKRLAQLLLISSDQHE